MNQSIETRSQLSSFKFTITSIETGKQTQFYYIYIFSIEVLLKHFFFFIRIDVNSYVIITRNKNYQIQKARNVLVINNY